MSTIVDTGDGTTYRIQTHNGQLRLSRFSSKGRLSEINFTTVGLLAVTNALIDAAEQLEQDNK